MRRDVFQAIADPVRRQIIEVIAAKPHTVNEVAAKFEISRPAISNHIKILGECGLVTIHQKGRERFCMINPASLVPAFMWIEQYKTLWEDRLDSFEAYVTDLKTKQQDHGTTQ